MCRTLALVLICVFLAGCAKKEENLYKDGTDARVEVKAQKGVCTYINTYDSGSYWSESWWYWSLGIEYTFAKSERIEESKSQEGFLNLTEKTTKIHYTDIVIDSTFTFNPITAPIKAANSIESKIKLPQNYEYIEPLQYW